MNERVYMPKADYVDICEAVREKKHSSEAYVSGELGDEIRSIDNGKTYFGFDYDLQPVDYDIKHYPERFEVDWTRPDDWPDLDALTIHKEELYLTVKNQQPSDFFAISVTCDSSYTVEGGTITNGEFVSLFGPTTVASAGIYSKNYDAALPEYIVYHVTVPNGESISNFYFSRLLGLDGSNYFSAQTNACVERYAWLPSITSLGRPTNRSFSCINIQHEHIKGITTACTSAASMFLDETELRKIDFVDCDFSAITSFSSAFRYCYSLMDIDFRDCSFGNNLVTMSYMFASCRALQNVLFPDGVLVRGKECDYMFNECYSIPAINLSWLDVSSATSFASMFSGCYNVSSISFAEGIEAVSVTSCASMFASCFKLAEIDLSFLKSSTITTFASTFSGLKSLQEIDLNGIYTGNVTTFASMFASSPAIKRIHFNSFDPAKATTLASMFSGCTSLEEVDLGDSSHHAATLCTSINSMFANCEVLRELDLDGLKLHLVTTMYGMFYQCYALNRLSLRDLELTACTDGSKSGTNYHPMFYQCYSLREVDLGGINLEATAQLYYKAGADSTTYPNRGIFYDAQAIRKVSLRGTSSSRITSVSWLWTNQADRASTLEELDLRDCEFTAATFAFASAFTSLRRLKKVDFTGISVAPTSVYSMFNGCYSLEEIPGFNDIDFSAVTRADSVFADCRSLKHADLHAYRLPLAVQCSSVFSGCRSLKDVDLSSFNLSSNAGSMASFFANCYELEEVSFPALAATSTVTSLESMFSNCYKLKRISMPLVVTNNVTSFSSMFANCYELEEVDVPSFNTSKATTYASMFSGCYKLKSIDLHTMTTPTTLTSVASMFLNCYSLEDVNLGSMTFDHVTDFSSMFSGCMSLKEIDVSHFNTSAATTFSTMFGYCGRLESIDLTNFLTTAVTNIANMFTACTNLRRIDMRNAVFTALTTANPSLFTTDAPVEYLRIGQPTANFTISACNRLTHDCLVDIFNDLPTLSSAKTFTIGANNLAKLTAAEKAVATGKRWTLA